MNDYNDIFGYQVYKPPPEKNLPIIADLNCPGEVITLIDPNADVIKDPAVQKIFKSLDGERTVKIEDLPPDVRYDGWNRKAQYDKQIITRNPAAPKTSMQPQLPVVNQNLLKEDENSQKYKQEALRQAQLKAMNAKNDDLEFNRQLHETKMALEKEIHRQLVEQLTLRAQKKSVTPEQQALIEKLYLDLRLINPELAFATLKASASLNETQSPTHQIVAPVARSAVSAVAPSSGRSSAASGPPPPTMSGSSSGVVRATVPKPTHPQQQQQRLTPSQAESQTRSSANKMSKVKPPTKQ